MIIDGGTTASNGWWMAVTASAVAAIISGTVFRIFKSYLSAKNESQRLQRLADDEERKRVETAITTLGLQLATEREERRNDILNESNIRRDKDDAIGRDLVRGINAIQNAFSYYCGKMDENRPRFDD